MLAHLIILPFFGEDAEPAPQTIAVWIPGTLGIATDQIEE